MEKLTDEQIVKALELCTTIKTSEACDECPFKRKCRDDNDILEKEALNLINRQKANIDNLNIELKAMRGSANSYKKLYEDSQKEVKKVRADLRYYLDTNEENGVVWIPKFTVDNLVKEMTEQKDDFKE